MTMAWRERSYSWNSWKVLNELFGVSHAVDKPGLLPMIQRVVGQSVLQKYHCKMQFQSDTLNSSWTHVLFVCQHCRPSVKIPFWGLPICCCPKIVESQAELFLVQTAGLAQLLEVLEASGKLRLKKIMCSIFAFFTQFSIYIRMCSSYFATVWDCNEQKISFWSSQSTWVQLSIFHFYH